MHPIPSGGTSPLRGGIKGGGRLVPILGPTATPSQPPRQGGGAVRCIGRIAFSTTGHAPIVMIHPRKVHEPFSRIPPLAGRDQGWGRLALILGPTSTPYQPPPSRGRCRPVNRTHRIFHRVIPAKAGTSVGDSCKENRGSRFRGNDVVVVTSSKQAVRSKHFPARGG